jgi:hypothetical protein
MRRYVRDLTKQERFLGWLISKLDRRLEKLQEREWEKHETALRRNGVEA